MKSAFLAWAAFCAACASTGGGEADLASVLERTQVLVDQAEQTARASGAGAEQFRGAWMRQDAARRAADRGEAPVAAKLSLQARRHAEKVLTVNGVAADPGLAGADPAEESLAGRADDGDHDRWMEEAERRTPPAAELLGPPPTGPEELATPVRALLDRSARMLGEAQAAAREGGKERDKFRGAWIRQDAAWRALADGRAHMAAKLGLQVRKLALKVLEGNGRKAAPALAATTPAEKDLERPVEDAPDADYDLRVAAAEADAPPLAELLEGALPGPR